MASICLFVFIIHARSDTLITKSGDLISSKTLRTVIKYSLYPSLAKHIFHLSPKGVLVSPAQTIGIYPFASTMKPYLLNSFERSALEEVSQPISSLSFCRGHGFTFMFERESNRLVSVFGHGLLINELDRRNYPGVFLNQYAEKPSKQFRVMKQQRKVAGPSNVLAGGVSVDTVPSRERQIKSNLSQERRSLEKKSVPRGSSKRKGPCASGVPRWVELAIAFDKIMCDNFNGNDQKLHKFTRTAVQDAGAIFERNTCVKLRIVFDGKTCKEETISPYFDDNEYRKAPLSLEKCSSIECEGASFVLANLRKFWRDRGNRLDLYPRNDAVLFFSGYNTGTNVVGAAFLKSICDPLLGFAWVETPRDGMRSTPEYDIMVAAIVHELGHLLGAKHDERGVMQSNLHHNDVKSLSDKSAYEISKFIDEDARSWCVSREVAITGFLNKTKWYHTRSYGEGKVFALGRGNMTRMSQVRKNEFILFDFRTYQRRRAVSLSSLFVMSKYIPAGIRKSRKGSPPNPPTGKYKAGLPDEVYKLTVVSSLSNTNHGSIMKDNSPYGSISVANIQSRFSNDVLVGEILPDLKSARYGILFQNKTGGYDKSSISSFRKFANWSERNVVSHSLICTSVASPLSKDLVWMYMTEGFGRRVLRYKVAINLDNSGRLENGWGPELVVPGWYGPQSGGISVWVHDVTDDGQPDLVFGFYEWSKATYSAYYRVGRNLDKKGRVTGGWSDFRPIEGDVEDVHHQIFYRFQQLMIADVGREQPMMMAWQGNSLQVPYNAFSELRFHTPKLTFAKLGKAMGCHKCLKSRYKILNCETDLKLCAATFDELRIHKDSLGKRTSRALSELRHVSKERHPQDIFCRGFNYLYQKKRDGSHNCDITDDEFVISNGIIEEYLHLLNETKPGVFFKESRIVNKERTTGVNGPKRKPTIGEVTLKVSRKGRIGAIRKALKRIGMPIGKFPDFKVKARAERVGVKTWKVILFFHAKFKKELPSSRIQKSEFRRTQLK